MAAGRVGATAITPYQHRKQIVCAKHADILRPENSVSGKCRFFHHYCLVRAGTAFFDNSGILRMSRDCR